MGKYENPSETPVVEIRSYKQLNYNDIEAWCIANGQTEWLKSTMAKKSTHKTYPKKLDPTTGKPIKYTDDKGKSHFIKDKEATPKVTQQPISFTKVKALFVDKFMPELKPEKKSKKPSMHQRAASL